MIFRGIKTFFIPLLAFTSLVTTGYAAWVFTSEMTATSVISGKVLVTGVTNIGSIEVKYDDTYYKSAYTLVFELGKEDQVGDENYGVTLYPSITFNFNNFQMPESGYAYYLTYTCYYNATYGTNSTQSLFPKYVTLMDATSTGTIDDANSAYDGKKFITSAETRLDISGATQVANTDNRYTKQYSNYSPRFKWVNGTKPSTNVQYNNFLKEVENSRSGGDSFEIVLTIKYKQIP